MRAGPRKMDGGADTYRITWSGAPAEPFNSRLASLQAGPYDADEFAPLRLGRMHALTTPRAYEHNARIQVARTELTARP